MKKDYNVLKALLKKIIDQILDDISEFNAIIIVEGKKDKYVLQKLGLPDTNIMLVSGKPIESILRAILSASPQKIYLFLDRDTQGKKLTKIIFDHLKDNTDAQIVNMWHIIQKELRKYGFKSIRKVEELKSIEKIVKDFNTNIIKKLRKITQKPEE